MDTLRILFDLAEQKPELSNDFLNEAQKQTDKTANEFWKELCNGWQFLADRVNGNISKQENSLINLSFNAQIISQLFYLAGLKNKEIYSKDGLTKEGLRITYYHLGNYALENRLNWYYYSFTGNPFIVSYNYSPVKVYELYKIESERQFKNELKNKKPEQIGEWLNIHLKKFVREGGNKADWVKHTRQFVNLLSIEQQDSFYNWIDANITETEPKQIVTKTDKLKEDLSKYGFFELPKLKTLSEPNKLIDLISNNDLPYNIAMIDFLGFIEHLKAKYFPTKDKLNKAVANLFDVTDRAVKGNINVLNPVSREDRSRYTADQQKKVVIKDYQTLK